MSKPAKQSNKAKNQPGTVVVEETALEAQVPPPATIEEATAEAPAQEDAVAKTAPIAEPLTGLRHDGPTLKQWVAAGYDAAAYPPAGYAAKVEHVHRNALGHPIDYRPMLFGYQIKKGQLK
jgi:hypothetical protein